MKKHHFSKNKLLDIIEEELKFELGEAVGRETQKTPSMAPSDPERVPTQKETPLNRQMMEKLYELDDKIETLESRLNRLYEWLTRSFQKSSGQEE